MTQWKKKNKKKQEGFSVKEGLETSSPTVSDDIDNIDTKIDDKLKKGIDDPYASFAKPKDVAANMGDELQSVLDGIDSLTKGNAFYDSLDSALTIGSDTKSLYGDVNLNYLNFKGLSGSLKTMMQQISSLISHFFQLFFSYLILIRKSVELFLLNFNTYLNKTLTKIAAALTQSTPSTTEMTLFQDQTQKFLMLLMVWVFVYNWYYVCFYVKEEDNIRYTFNADHVQNYSMLLYSMFGPACRTIETFNSIIMWTAKTIQKYVGNNFIYVGMFFLFMTLVAANFQTVLIIDFFNALHHQYGTSVISIFTMGCVAYYGFKYVKNDSIIPSFFWWAFPFGIVLFLIALVFYIMWTVAVNIPLGILFIFTYLFVYSFMGVLFYQGSNVFNTFTGISENISNIEPDLTKDDICINPPGFHWSSLHHYVWYYMKKTGNWMTAYMFEILIILMLFGGIGLYSKQFKSSIAGKFSASSMSPASIKESFKFLFTWLIIINIILIALLITFMVQKYKYIQSEIPPANVVLPGADVDVPESKGAFEGDDFLTPPSNRSV
jgi:hypothetical protein